MRTICFISYVIMVSAGGVYASLISNGDFEGGTVKNDLVTPGTQNTWRSDRADYAAPADWYSSLAPSLINGNYGEPVTGYGSGNCAALKALSGNYYQQVLSGVDAGTSGSYTVSYDGGVRYHSSYTGPAGRNITLRVSLWDVTADVELAGVDVVTPFSSAATSLQARTHDFVYDNAGLAGHVLALRLANTTVLEGSTTANDNQVLFDNIHVVSDRTVLPVSPQNNVVNVPIDEAPTLEWIASTHPGLMQHILYFSTDENWVAFALPTDPAVAVLTASAASYLHDHSLAYETTYHWRVDEVIGDPGNPNIVQTGPVWRFTTEPMPSKPCEGYNFDGDIDGDCLADMTDLVLLIQDWMKTGIVTDADINEDSTVDLADFFYLGRDWLSDIEYLKPLMMFISTHPDDEGIFFGGIMPYYARVLNLPVIHVSVTSGDWHLNNLSVREAELINADAIYLGRPVTASVGLFPNPSADLHFLRRRDVSGGSYPDVDQVWDWWYNNAYDDYADTEEGKQLVINTLATYIRVFRPDVIVTQDFDGEYGHPNHKAAATGVAEAYDRAADPGYADGNQPWTAKKLYVHQSEANGLGTTGHSFINWLFHDFCEETSIDTDGNGIADMTPRQVADWGLNQHISQGRPDVSTVYRTGENFDGHHSEWWGLYRSTVGPDTTGRSFSIMGRDYNDGANDGWAIGNFLENLPETRNP